MTITQKNEDGRVTIVLDGWLDLESAPQLGEVTEKIDSAKELIIDFEKVEYISSAGIRMLVTAHRKARELEAEFSIIKVNNEVMSIIAMTGLDKKFNIQAQ